VEKSETADRRPQCQHECVCKVWLRSAAY